MRATRRGGLVTAILLLLGASLSDPLQGQDPEQVGTLTLSGAVELALDRNPSVQAAAAADSSTAAAAA